MERKAPKVPFFVLSVVVNMATVNDSNSAVGKHMHFLNRVILRLV